MKTRLQNEKSSIEFTANIHIDRHSKNFILSYTGGPGELSVTEKYDTIFVVMVI